MDSARFQTWTPYLLSLMRIMAGLLFLQHGTMKFLGIPAGNAPGVGSLPWFAGLIELIAGTLIVLGLFTRPAAFIASGTMAFAYFIAHAPSGFYPILNRGELAALYCFVFLFLAAAGSGPIGLDAQLRRSGRLPAWA